MDGHYSKTYGINRKSSLLNVKYYNMFHNGLPHDAMHDILEGVAPYEVKLVLSHYVSQGQFTLAEFNDRLVHLNFGYSENDKPILIFSKDLKEDKKSLRASSAQMLLLVRVLIGDKINPDDPHWGCFLLLRRIIDIALCPLVTEGNCSSLKLLIHEHHSQFVALYGSAAYIPKMHFLTHYSDQMEAMGPMLCN